MFFLLSSMYTTKTYLKRENFRLTILDVLYVFEDSEHGFIFLENICLRINLPLCKLAEIFTETHRLSSDQLPVPRPYPTV